MISVWFIFSAALFDILSKTMLSSSLLGKSFTLSIPNVHVLYAIYLQFQFISILFSRPGYWYEFYHCFTSTFYYYKRGVEGV